MASVPAIALLFAMAIATAAAQSLQDALAHFKHPHFQGTVRFRDNAPGIQVDTSGLIGNFTSVELAIHTLPLEAGTADVGCDPARSGGVYNPTSATTPLGTLFTKMLGKMNVTTVLNLRVSGMNGILGRSLFLSVKLPSVSSNAACANIVPAVNIRGEACSNDVAQYALEAVFNGHLAGRVTLSTLRSQRLFGAANGVVHAQLRYTGSTPTPSPVTLALALAPLSTCRSASLLGNATVGGNGSQAAVSVLTRTINTLANWAGMGLRITSGTMFIACAILQPTARQYSASFGTSGNVTVQQDSRFTNPRVTLSRAQPLAAITILQDRAPATIHCAHFSRTVFSPPGLPTMPLRVGDLSGKAMTSTSFCDRTLTLFGTNSIAGRTAYTVRGVALFCPELVSATNMRVIRAKAVFTRTKSTLQGTIYLEQGVAADGTLGPTTIYSTGLTNVAGVVTKGHSWHVHSGRVGFEASAVACNQAGPHFNPFNVSIAYSYRRDCNGRNPLRCELGDSAGKFGALSIDTKPFFYSDPYLPLSGENFVIGRSFVIHAANGGGRRTACANIIPLTATVVQLGYSISAVTPATLVTSGFNSTAFQTLLRRSSASAANVRLFTFNVFPQVAKGCIYVSLILDGGNVTEVAAGLPTLTNLGVYSQSPRCTVGVVFPSAASPSARYMVVLLFSALLVAAML